MRFVCVGIDHFGMDMFLNHFPPLNCYFNRFLVAHYHFTDSETYKFWPRTVCASDWILFSLLTWWEASWVELVWCEEWFRTDEIGMGFLFKCYISSAKSPMNTPRNVKKKKPPELGGKQFLKCRVKANDSVLRSSDGEPKKWWKKRKRHCWFICYRFASYFLHFSSTEFCSVRFWNTFSPETTSFDILRCAKWRKKHLHCSISLKFIVYFVLFCFFFLVFAEV